MIRVSFKYVLNFWFFTTLVLVTEACAEEPVDIIARVGDQNITLNQIDIMINSSASVGIGIPTPGSPERNKLRLKLLDKVISANLLYLDALQKGVQNNHVYENDVERFSQAILVSLYREKHLVGEIVVTDDQVVEYFKKNVATGTTLTDDIKVSIEAVLRKERFQSKTEGMRERLRSGITVLLDDTKLSPDSDDKRNSNEVVAIIDHKKITWEEFGKSLAGTNKKRDVEKRIDALNRFIDNKIMVEKAKNMGMEEDPLFLARVNEFKKVRLVNIHRAKLTQDMQPTDKELHSYFDKNRDKISIKEARKVQMVVLKSLKEAEVLKTRIETNDITMFQAAAEYSIDPNAKKSLGEIGWVNKGTGFPELDELTFSMGLEELGGPVETPAGWHLVKVQEIRDAAFQGIDDDRARKKTQRMLIHDKLNQYVINLRKEHFAVEVFEEVFNKLIKEEVEKPQPVSKEVKKKVSMTNPPTKDKRDSSDHGGIPPRDYLILINYELGMHCTGFDFAYCCILPPYNSILAQVVKTERSGKKPVLLGSDPDDSEILVDGEKRFKLSYTHEDPDGIPNTYSASKKLVYWGVGYKGRSLPDHEFSHLYIYKDLEGSNPDKSSDDQKKLHVGIEVPIKFNQGPTGQHVGKGFLRYTGDKGTVVYTDSPVMENVPIKLTNPRIWEALGLPLTPFNDDFTALIYLDETMVQPFQKSVVTLVDANSLEPVIDSSGQVVRFFGVNPIDVPNCARCHSNERANGTEYQKYKAEYAFWKEVRGSGKWYAELKAAAISILEIHDANHGTNFLGKWPGGPNTYIRLGRDSVLCKECHADNITGMLFSKKAGEMPENDIQKGHPNIPEPDHLISPLTEAIHKVHLRKTPLPDAMGFEGGCQLCHPSHRSDRSMNKFPLTLDGNNFFENGDIRDSKGCFTRRDVHANPNRNRDGAETKSHLNAIGSYLLSDVMNSDGEDKGLYCTNCHNMMSRELYKADYLYDEIEQTGRTLRNRSLKEIAINLGVRVEELTEHYINPKIPHIDGDTNNGVYQIWERTGQVMADFARIKVDKKGESELTVPDKDGDRSVIIVDTNPSGNRGVSISYDDATHGRDYWLAPGEPHCADCHSPPFVESMGGGAFPLDQTGKYALMRYSKGHSDITCQGCHESTHGLYPVNPEVDIVSYQQAAFINSDNSHGPVKCGACHRVNEYGVPSQQPDVIGKDGPYLKNYEKAVELMHTLR